jgi:hypothetical protein
MIIMKNKDEILPFGQNDKGERSPGPFDTNLRTIASRGMTAGHEIASDTTLAMTEAGI